MTTKSTPWYKQFWPWFILSPLLIVICAGFWMLYIAIVTNDGVIIDNYYKDGLGIEVRTEQDTLARDLGLQANMVWIDQSITLTLTGAMNGYPNQLSLLVIFPTQSSQDVNLLLTHQGAGIYSGSSPEGIKGKRELQLEPVTESSTSMWRLHAQTNLPLLSSQVVLAPKVE